jgi:hypothetical protein
VLAPLAAGGHGLALLLLMALTATLGVQIYLLARDVAGAGPAIATWLALAFSPPLLLYADQLYPEVPGALLTIIGVRAILAARAARARGEGAPRTLLGVQVGVAVALLPWFHLRYLPLSAVLADSAAWALWPRSADGPTGGPWRRPSGPLLGFTAPAALAGVGLLTLYWRLFRGVPTVDEYGAVAVQNLLLGAPGLLLDQQYGLLTYAPVFLIAVLGLPLIAGSVPGRGGLVVWAVLGCYFLFIASFSVWYGSFSPPARMLVPLVPVLAVPFALAVRRWQHARFRVFAAALLVGSWSIAHLLMDVPWLRYNQPSGESEMLRYLSQVWGVDLVPLFPSFQVATVRGYAWCLAATAGVTILWFLLTRPPRARHARRPEADPAIGPPEGAVRAAPIPVQSYSSLHDVLTVESRIPPGQRVSG